MAKSNRIDTNALFTGMIGKETTTETTDVPIGQKKEDRLSVSIPAQQEAVTAKGGRKSNGGKNIQVSVYLTPKQARELRLQDAEKEKEADKSAIVRTGLDIVLALSNEEYIALKSAAQQQNTTPGYIVKEALKKYL